MMVNSKGFALTNAQKMQPSAVLTSALSEMSKDVENNSPAANLYVKTFTSGWEDCSVDQE